MNRQEIDEFYDELEIMTSLLGYSTERFEYRDGKRIVFKKGNTNKASVNYSVLYNIDDFDVYDHTLYKHHPELSKQQVRKILFEIL